MASLSALSNHSLFCLTGEIHQHLQVIESEQSTVVPGSGLILERTREGPQAEWALLAHSLPDRRLAVAPSQRGAGRLHEVLVTMVFSHCVNR